MKNPRLFLFLYIYTSWIGVFERSPSLPQRHYWNVAYTARITGTIGCPVPRWRGVGILSIELPFLPLLFFGDLHTFRFLVMLNPLSIASGDIANVPVLLFPSAALLLVRVASVLPMPGYCWEESRTPECLQLEATMTLVMLVNIRVVYISIVLDGLTLKTTMPLFFFLAWIRCV